MQLVVPEGERATVFGVQNAVQQLLSMAKDVAVIGLPDPRTFGLLVCASVACVFLGFLQYLYYLLMGKKGKKSDDE
jgi:hypothetical protein